MAKFNLNLYRSVAVVYSVGYFTIISLYTKTLKCSFSYVFQNLQCYCQGFFFIILVSVLDTFKKLKGSQILFLLQLI